MTMSEKEYSIEAVGKKAARMLLAGDTAQRRLREQYEAADSLAG